MNKKTNEKKSKWRIVILVIFMIIGAVLLITFFKPIPYRILTEYPFEMIESQTTRMLDCAECHDTSNFHTCDTCHGIHGSAALVGLNFYSTVHLTGDVPEEKFIPTNQIFLEEKHKVGKITVDEFLKQHGVEDYMSVTFASNDGGFTTVKKDQLGGTSFLLPYEDGVRFADENLHISTWIKGVTKIIVEGANKNLIIGGKSYSLGELMLKDTIQFTVEQAQVMFKSSSDGTIRTAFTAERLEGIALDNLLDLQASNNFAVTTKDGNIFWVDQEELMGAKIVLINKEITLVFPEKSRNQWIFGVVAISEAN